MYSSLRTAWRLLCVFFFKTIIKISVSSTFVTILLKEQDILEINCKGSGKCRLQYKICSTDCKQKDTWEATRHSADLSTILTTYPGLE